MEGSEPAQLPEAPFPRPPPFWRHFTTANEASIKSLTSSSSGLPAKLPIPLAYLRPPPSPAAVIKEYPLFNQSQVVDATKLVALPPESDLLFDPRDPSTNLPVLLSRLTKSLMLNFLEFNTILSRDPTKHSEKMDDLRKIILNIHLVINLYRPHQAREEVKEMLKAKLEGGKREMEACDALKERIEEFLGNISKIQSSVSKMPTPDEMLDAEDMRMTEQKKLWKLIHDLDLRDDS